MKPKAIQNLESSQEDFFDCLINLQEKAEKATKKGDKKLAMEYVGVVIQGIIEGDKVMRRINKAMFDAE